MCAPQGTGSADVTIKTPDKKPTSIAEPMGDAPKPTGSANNFGFSVLPPKDSPDITDQAVRARRMAQALQLLSGRGRKQSFLGGNYDSDTLGAGSILGGS